MDAGLGAIKKNRFNQHMGEIDLSNEVPISGPSTQKTSFSPQQQQQQQQQQQYSNNNMGYGMVPPGQRQYTNNTGYPMMSQPQQQQINPRINYNGYSNGNPRMAMPVQPEIRSNTMPTRFESSPMSMSRNNNPSHNNNNNSNNHSFNFSKGKHTLTNIFKKKNNSPMGAGGFDIADDDDDDDFGTGSSKNNNNSVNNNSFNGGVGDMNNNDEEVTVDSNEILTFSDITGLRNTGGPNYGGSQRDDTAPIIPTLVTKINQKPSKLSNTEYRKMMFNQKKMAMSTLSKQHSNQTAPPPPRTMSLQGNWNAMPQQQPGGRPMPNTRFAGPPNGQPAYPRSNSMMNSGMPPPRFRQQPQLMQQGFPQHQQPMYQEQSPRAMSLTNTPRFMNSGMNPQPHLSQQQQQQPQDPYFNNNVDRSNNLPQDNFSLPNNGRAMSMQNKSVNPMFNGQGMTTYNNNNNNNSNNTHNQDANITNVHRNGDNNMNNKTLNLSGRTNIPSSFSSSDLLNNAKSQHLQYRKPFVQSQSLNNIKENASNNNNNNIRDNKNVNNYKNLPSTRSNLSHEFNINDVDNNKQQDNTTGNENGAISNANVTNTRSASDVSIEIIDNPSIKQPDITNIKKNNKNGSVDSFDFTDKTPEDQQIIDTTLPKNNTAQPFKPAAAIVNNSGNTHSIDEYNNSENSYHISLRPNTHRKTLSADLRPGSALFSGLSPNSSNSFANTNGMLNGQHSKTNSTVSSIGEPTPNYQQKKMYALANNTTDMNLYVTADEFPTDSKGFTSSSSVSPPQRDNRLDSLTAQFQNKNNMGNVDANQTYSTLLGTVQDTSDATIENDLEDNSTTNSKNASRSSDIFDPNFSNEQFVKVEANSNIDKRKSLIEVKDNKTYSTKTDIVSSNTTPVLMANNVFDSDQTPQVDKTHRPKSNDVVLLDQLPSDPGKNDEVEGLRVEEITISQTIEQNRRSSFTNVNNNSHSKLNATSGSTRIISINSQTSSSKSSNYSTAENQEEKQQQQQQQQESSLNALKADTCTKKTTVEPGDVSNGSVKSASSNMKSIKSKLNEKPLNKAKKFFRKFSAQKKDTSENQKSSDNDASTITTATNTLTDTADMSFVQDDPLFANKEILKPEPLPPIPQQEPLPLMFSQEDDFVENNSPTNKPIPPQFSSQISKDISNSGENNGNVEIKIEMPSTSGLERSHKPLPLVTNKDSHDNKENITNSFSSNTDQSEFKSKEIITKVWDESDKDANPRKSYHSLFSGPSPGPNKIKFFNQSGTPSPLQSSFNNDPERTVLYDVSDISDAASSTNNNKDSDSGNTNNVNIDLTSNVTKTHPQQRAPTTPQSLDEGKNANSQALETINESDAPNTIVTSGTKDNVDNDTVSKVITNNSVYLASPSTVNTEDFALMNNPEQVLYQPSFVSNPDKELYVTKKVYSAGNESDQQHTQHSEDARFKTFVISPEQLSVLGENRKLMNELTMVSTELAESIARETALEKILNEKEYQNNDTHGEVFSNRDTNSIEDDNRGLNDMINIQSELRKKSSKIVTLIQELNAERLKRFIAEEQVLLYEKGCKPSNLELSYDINSLQKQLQEKNHEIECLRAQIGHS
ncbi:uncharacterized protein SCODWIG_00759 [Saccharomycodes ludwigii]|uniref:Uncharacterized protein n=1 Tax=Saccharomycodes ludwigii TaxID=36035 RepID=A0A376B2T8_9ASCO|nr:uncharacterized protein SCODWIG_00759 [Saccharomycodes ludwigii]